MIDLFSAAEQRLQAGEGRLAQFSLDRIQLSKPDVSYPEHGSPPRLPQAGTACQPPPYTLSNADFTARMAARTHLSIRYCLLSFALDNSLYTNMTVLLLKYGSILVGLLYLAKLGK